MDLKYCRKVADDGRRPSREGCPILQRIRLSVCSRIADEGLWALSAGRRVCQHIDFEFYGEVFDERLRVSSAGCRIGGVRVAWRALQLGRRLPDFHGRVWSIRGIPHRHCGLRRSSEAPTERCVRQLSCRRRRPQLSRWRWNWPYDLARE